MASPLVGFGFVRIEVRAIALAPRVVEVVVEHLGLDVHLGGEVDPEALLDPALVPGQRQEGVPCAHAAAPRPHFNQLYEALLEAAFEVWVLHLGVGI